jgi:SAM-dependent methyltransferase
VSEGSRHPAVRWHWDRPDLRSAIKSALEGAGVDPATLTVEDLAPLDQFHAGGMALTRGLAALAELKPGTSVLDVGGGLGGPARTLAAEFGCKVALVDVAASYVEAARLLTLSLGLDGKVTHVVADGLELPFAAGAFDVVWTQNSGMNIAEKQRLHLEFHRVLRVGGRLATQEPMAGPVKPLIFPVMWAADESTSFLRTPDEMRSLIESVGFRKLGWEYTKPVKPAAGIERRISFQRIQSLVMGEAIEAIRASGRRNNAEGRLVTVQAVFEKV